MTDEEIAAGRVYPKLDRIRTISATVAAAVVERALQEVQPTLVNLFDCMLTRYHQGVAQIERPEDILALVQDNMYFPEYLELNQQ